MAFIRFGKVFSQQLFIVLCNNTNHMLLLSHFEILSHERVGHCSTMSSQKQFRFGYKNGQQRKKIISQNDRRPTDSCEYVSSEQ